MDEDEDEDDWLEPSEPQGGPNDPLAEKEYQRLTTRYSDAGYREGITDGKLSTLQLGFDQGFALSVPASRRLGKLRGRANALLAWLNQITPPQSRSAPEASEVVALRDLVRDLGRVRKVDVLPKDEERERHEIEAHGEEDGFELDTNDGRDLENLEEGMDRFTGNTESVGGKEGKEVSEGEGSGLLVELEGRLKVIEGKILRR